MDHPVTDARPLLVVGELNVDLIVLVDGEIHFGQHEQLSPSTTLTMGSSSAITACGAARLGVPTTLVAVRGDDVFGRYLHDELTKRGVDTSLVRVDATRPTGSGVHLSRPDGDRAILTTMGSIGAVTVADVIDAALDAAAHLHVGSYFLQETLWPDAAALFQRARAHGLTTSVDGNFDPTGNWDSGIRGVLAHTDVFFGNEQELAGITGESDSDAAIDSLLALLPDGGVAVLKYGAAGASAARRVDGATTIITAAPPDLAAPIVDTVGAGDSLAAGFLAGLLRDLPLDESLALAVACGTAATRGAGGITGQVDFATAHSLASS